MFSEVVKLGGTVEREGAAETGGLYDFHESIVNALRPVLKEGVKSMVIVAPGRTDYAKIFLDHIRKHHPWLVRKGPNSATFGELTGSARQLHDVHELVKTKGFREAIAETTSRDAESIVASLEKSLGSDNSGTVVSYSLEEIEVLVYGRGRQGSARAKHVVLTDRYLANSEDRRRVQRLLQISKNRGIKVTIVKAETRAGVRISQLGGLVCFASKNGNRRT